MSTLVVNITADYEHLLIDINLTIPLKGIVGIFGPSGSGKTTLLKAIAGLNKQVFGTIAIDDRQLLDSKSNTYVATEHRHITGVFQQDGLFPHLTVEENLTYAIKRRKTERLDLKSIIEHTKIGHLLDQNTTSLSGGERQKVAIARALLAEPTLLILDEPVTALDRASKANILRVIKTVQKEFEIPILYVSHNLEELQALSEKLIVISSGKIIEQGTTDEVIHKLNHSQLIDKQTSLTVTFVDSVNHFGLVELALNQQTSLYALDEVFSKQKNTHYRCYILARDVSISINLPDQSSIVNQVAGLITDIEINGYQVLVTVKVQEQTFYASISSYSLEQLGLAIGTHVYLQFKASAIRQVIY